MHSGQNKIYDEAFRDLLIDLAEICDSIDQLGKLARVVHLLYLPLDPDARLIHEQIRKTYVHVRQHNNQLGWNRAWRERKAAQGAHWDDTPQLAGDLLNLVQQPQD